MDNYKKEELIKPDYVDLLDHNAKELKRILKELTTSTFNQHLSEAKNIVTEVKGILVSAQQPELPFINKE